MCNQLAPRSRKLSENGLIRDYHAQFAGKLRIISVLFITVIIHFFSILLLYFIFFPFQLEPVTRRIRHWKRSLMAGQRFLLNAFIHLFCLCAMMASFCIRPVRPPHSISLCCLLCIFISPARQPAPLVCMHYICSVSASVRACE